jgi:hypothetical protein
MLARFFTRNFDQIGSAVSQETSYRQVARITGLILLIVTITHMAGFQISNRFSVSDDVFATAQNISTNQPLYRIATLSYLASSMLSLALGICFYLLVKPINQTAALVVLAFRSFDALLGSTGWATRFAMIENLTKENGLGDAGKQALHNALRDFSSALFDISTIGFSVAVIFGFTCFIWAKTIPRIFSIISILGALVVAVTAAITLFDPNTNLPSHLAFAITLLSQLAIGAWLLIRGARLPIKA